MPVSVRIIDCRFYFRCIFCNFVVAKEAFAFLPVGNVWSLISIFDCIVLILKKLEKEILASFKTGTEVEL